MKGCREMYRRCRALIYSIFLTTTLSADEKVSLQLQWLHQFQFAGYYMAKEKGFYHDVGLDVSIKEYVHGLDVVEEVLSTRVDFGVGRTSIYIDRSEGKDVVALAAIFQTSPMVLLGLASSDLQLGVGLEGKTIMVTAEARSSVPLMTMIKANGGDPQMMTQLPHSFDLEDLITKKTDLMASYISNEPFRLESRGIDYVVFDPKDSGFDFYDDLLFTSGEQIRTKHLQTRAFKEASLKGWQYAFDNMGETVDLILHKYNTQERSAAELLYEAKALKRLAYYETKQIGVMTAKKSQRISDAYRVMGLVTRPIDMDVFLHYECGHLLTPEDELWVKEHRAVGYAGFASRLPYEGFGKDGSYVGIINEYIGLIETKTGLGLQPRKVKDHAEVVKLGREGKIEMIGGTFPKGEEQDFVPSEVFRRTKVIFVGRGDQDYVEKIDHVRSKKLGLIDKARYSSELRKRHPEITFFEIKSIGKGLEDVADGSLDLLLAPIDIVTDTMARMGLHELKVVGKSEVETEQRFYIHKDRPMLLKIVNKAIAYIDESERDAIEKKWFTQKYVERVDYTSLWISLAVFVSLGLLLLYRQRWLTRYNEELLAKQKELAANNEEFSALINTSPQGLFIFEHECCVDINKAAISIFALKDKAAALGKEPYAFFSPRSHVLVREHIEQHSDEPYEAFSAKDDRPLLIQGRNIETSKRAIRIVSIVDLTKVKEQERIISEQSKMVSLGEMITNISHHWRQPLAVIGMEANSILADIDLDTIEIEQLRLDVSEIARQTQQLSSSIVDFGYLVNDDLKSGTFDLTHSIEKVLSMQSSKLAASGIAVQKELEEGLLVNSYERALLQVFVNLIDNACDALMKIDVHERVLLIKAVRDGDKVIVRIRDSGGGIDKSLLDKLFEPYTTTKHKRAGTGMGLYFVYKTVMEKLEGEINAKNVLFHDSEKQYEGAEITVIVGIDERVQRPKEGIEDEI